MNRLTLIAVSLTLGFAATPVIGAQLDVPGQYGSIQGAIDAALDGDVIVVMPGVYQETINFNGKAITLRSAQGPASTLIDGSGELASVVSCVNDEEEDTVLEGFTITGGSGTLWGPGARIGGGMYNFGSSPTVRNCVFIDNDADEGAGMHNFGAQTTVIDCVFESNRSTFGQGGVGGGGGMANISSAPTIINCIFKHNSSGYVGGAMSNSNARAEIVNCAFIENEAPFGGAIRNYLQLAPTVTNCTFVRNTASYGGAIRSSQLCVTSATNCIFWENGPDDVSDAAGAVTTVSYSVISGTGFAAGDGNVQSDPQFVDLDNHNLQLVASSPAVNAGSNAALPADVADLDGDGNFSEPTPIDLEGDTRVLNSTVDMGVCERQSTAPPTTGACCFSDGSCFEIPAANCTFAGGVFSGIGAECVASSCEDPSESCDGDVNGDTVVDVFDLTDMLAAWGDCSGSCSSCAADVSGPNGVGDCTVDTWDMLAIIEKWGLCE